MEEIARHSLQNPPVFDQKCFENAGFGDLFAFLIACADKSRGFHARIRPPDLHRLHADTLFVHFGGQTFERLDGNVEPSLPRFHDADARLVALVRLEQLNQVPAQG